MRVKTFPIGALWNQQIPPHWLHGEATRLPAGSPVLGNRQHSGGYLPPDAATPQVELLEWDDALSRRDAWKALSLRALEGNVFLTPEFALSAVQHIPVSRRPSFLFVWASALHGDPKDLAGIFALHLPAPGDGRIARLWCTPMMALGAPLIDRHRGHATVDLLHRYIAEEHPHIRALLAPQISLQGPVANLFSRHARAANLDTRILDRRSRAVVTNRDDPEDFLRLFISPRKRKELRRQRRRLEEMGALTYTSARSPEEVRIAMERFLILEASGWKGNRHTALLSDPSTATFARAMSRHFAQNGTCRIDALELNGRQIAMGIVLTADDVAFYWKTAYDENYARYSPGVLFSIDLTISMMGDGMHEMINSCAIPNHPMIDHIWRERLEIGDMLIATPMANARSFALAAGVETASRRIRSVAKQAFYALRGQQKR